MPLDYQMRCKLEETIEFYLTHTSALLKAFRQDAQKLHIQNPEEFVFGYVVGNINARFDDDFEYSRTRGMNSEEADDMHRIIENRMPHIRKVILNTR